MTDPDIKIDHDGFTLLRPITAFCGSAPGTVTRRASVTADVFGDTYVAEFDIVPGETVTLPPPGPDETGVWRKVDGYEREPEPEEEPEDDSPATHYYRAGWEAAIEQLTGSLAIRGEQPEDTARRIRTELAALRGALADVRQQLLLATEAASRARDGEGEAKKQAEFAELEALAIGWLFEDYQLDHDRTRIVTAESLKEGHPTFASAARERGWAP